MFVLDTNIVSEASRPRPDRQVMDWLEACVHADLRITSITFAELHLGVSLLQPSRRRDELALFVERVATEFADRMLSFTVADAPFFGEIVARRRRLGRPVDLPDAMLAAIAWRHGMTLVTRNTRDFLDLGIDLVDPFVG